MIDLRRFLVIACGVTALATTANAQENPEAAVSADVVNQYIWRGQDLGDVSLQPTLGVSYKGLSLTAWGSVGLSDNEDTKEFDLTLAYQAGKFNIGITDYWFNSPNERYFSYAAHKTSHVFEANIGYDFGPCAVQWYTNFAGNDGINKSGDRAYSSYVEVNAPFRLAGCDWSAAIGAVPYATSFYGDAGGFAVTNVSLKARRTSISQRRSAYRCSPEYQPTRVRRRHTCSSVSPCGRDKRRICAGKRLLWQILDISLHKIFPSSPRTLSSRRTPQTKRT